MIFGTSKDTSTTDQPASSSNMQISNDQPPSYDTALRSPGPTDRLLGPSSAGPSNVAGQAPSKAGDGQYLGASQQPTGKPAPPSMTAPPQRMVYHYRHPERGTISSPFPPDHPRSLCLMHGHMPHTTHGLLGVLAAIFFFPIGIALCMVDRRSTCARCGEVLEDGLF